MISTFVHFTFLQSSERRSTQLLDLAFAAANEHSMRGYLWQGSKSKRRLITLQNFSKIETPFTRLEVTGNSRNRAGWKLDSASLDPSPLSAECLPAYLQSDLPRKWLTIAHQQKRVVLLGLKKYPHLFRFSMVFKGKGFLDTASLVHLIERLSSRAMGDQVIGFLDVSPMKRLAVGIDMPNQLCSACATFQRLAFDRLHRAMFASKQTCVDIIRANKTQVSFSALNESGLSAVLLTESFDQPQTEEKFIFTDVLNSDVTKHMNY